VTELDGAELRALIAITVREAVADMVTASVRKAASDQPASDAAIATAVAVRPTGSMVDSAAPGRSRPKAVSGKGRVESIKIGNDEDLDRFARHLLELFENPKSRQDLIAGRHRFILAPGHTPVGPPAHVRRIERGAVTERCVIAAADAGERLLLGRAAVLTPLGREKARSLGVHVEKEH
jgi:hypothetical protein